MFRLLFIDDMDLDMIIADDFYREIDNVEKAKASFLPHTLSPTVVCLTRDFMSIFPTTRLRYIAADGCSLFMQEAVDAMDNETFQLYLKYHFAVCEREDLSGVTSHAVNIFKKQS